MQKYARFVSRLPQTDDAATLLYNRDSSLWKEWCDVIVVCVETYRTQNRLGIHELENIFKFIKKREKLEKSHSTLSCRKPS